MRLKESCTSLASGLLSDLTGLIKDEWRGSNVQRSTNADRSSRKVQPGRMKENVWRSKEEGRRGRGSHQWQAQCKWKQGNGCGESSCPTKGSPTTGMGVLVINIRPDAWTSGHEVGVDVGPAGHRLDSIAVIDMMPCG